MHIFLAFLSIAVAGGPMKGASFPMELIEKLKYVAPSQPSFPQWKGKVVMVDFWATWCGPCKKAIPAYGSLEKSYSSKGFVVVGVNLDDTLEEAKAYLAQTPAGFHQVFGGQETAAGVGIESVPVMYLIDRKGIIQHIHCGFKAGEEKDIEKRIQVLLGQK